MILAPRPPQIQYRTVPYVQSTYTVTVSTGEGLHCPVLYTFSKLTPATPILTVRRCAHTVGASVSTVCSVAHLTHHGAPRNHARNTPPGQIPPFTAEGVHAGDGC